MWIFNPLKSHFIKTQVDDILFVIKLYHLQKTVIRVTNAPVSTAEEAAVSH